MSLNWFLKAINKIVHIKASARGGDALMCQVKTTSKKKIGEGGEKGEIMRTLTKPQFAKV
jgi:hypothetical protein